MKVSVPGIRQVRIKSEFIKLDSLLKFASIVSSGGEAKIAIQSGEVSVDGEPCENRGKKIRPGSVVVFNGETLLVKENQHKRIPDVVDTTPTRSV